MLKSETHDLLVSALNQAMATDPASKQKLYQAINQYLEPEHHKTTNGWRKWIKRVGLKDWVDQQFRIRTKERPEGLTDEEWDIICHHRSISESEERTSLLEAECAAAGLDINAVKHFWYKSELFSINAHGPGFSYADIRDDFIASIQNYAPIYPTSLYPTTLQPSLLVISLADIHIGKLGIRDKDDALTYDVDIAIERMLAGIDGILKKASVYEVHKIVLLFGGDYIHSEATRTTTKGTPLELTTDWYSIFRAAREAAVKAVELCMSVAPVHVIVAHGNHDKYASLMMFDGLESWFHNTDAVTFDNGPAPRKYLQYGNQIIMTGHGDGCKEADIQHLVAVEARAAWSQTKWCYAYLAHLHHKVRGIWDGKQSLQVEKDVPGLTIMNTGIIPDASNKVYVEVVRTPSGTDAWSNDRGYTGNGAAIEGFIHDAQDGQIARLTHWF